MRAQTARGAQLTEGKLIARLRAWIPVMIPLLVQLFRRADTLALAMESRCYTGTGRTRLRTLTFSKGDCCALIVTVLLAVTLMVLK
jgi:energy-coupling factor transport system permease protein